MMIMMIMLMMIIMIIMIIIMIIIYFLILNFKILRRSEKLEYLMSTNLNGVEYVGDEK